MDDGELCNSAREFSGWRDINSRDQFGLSPSHVGRSELLCIAREGRNASASQRGEPAPVANPSALRARRIFLEAVATADRSRSSRVLPAHHAPSVRQSPGSGFQRAERAPCLLRHPRRLIDIGSDRREMPISPGNSSSARLQVCRANSNSPAVIVLAHDRVPIRIQRVEREHSSLIVQAAIHLAQFVEQVCARPAATSALAGYSASSARYTAAAPSTSPATTNRKSSACRLQVSMGSRHAAERGLCQRLFGRFSSPEGDRSSSPMKYRNSSHDGGEQAPTPDGEVRIEPYGIFECRNCCDRISLSPSRSPFGKSACA